MIEEEETQKNGIIASNTERFILKNLMPLLLKNKVKAVILVLYGILTAVSIYGCT